MSNIQVRLNLSEIGTLISEVLVLSTNVGTPTPMSVTKVQLLLGVNVEVDASATSITIHSTGQCTTSYTMQIQGKPSTTTTTTTEVPITTTTTTNDQTTTTTSTTTSTTTTTTSTTTTSTTTAAPAGLELTFNDIANANLMISGSSTDVSKWNTFFDLPTNGSVFTSVNVVGNTVNLLGGSLMNIKANVFYYSAYRTALLSIKDYEGIVISTGTSCCRQCSNLHTIDLRYTPSIGAGSFDRCYPLYYINLSSCTNLGGTTGNNNVFYDITGNVITLTVPSALMTCLGGYPDYDIQNLQTLNTVTVIQV